MLSDLNYYSKLITVTLVPLFVLALLALLVAAVRVLSRVKDPTKLKRLKAKIVEGCSFASLSFLFVMYPFVSHMILGTFSCVQLVPGSNSAWLRTDL